MALSDLQTEYVGTKGRLFKLALVTSLFTVLTLGIYRFWMKTRLRRFYWSAIRPGGQPLEYVGEPMEKLLGFLIAVVFLAFYIGIVNLFLMFLSFSLFQGNVVAYAVSFIGVIPVMFFARYRARRYILARTRWRGIRFGMDPGAWGYAWRAIVHWLITIGSLGLLWPRMTFHLEKYRTDRTQFGSANLAQGGRWTMLYRTFAIALAGAVIMLAAGVIALQDDIGLAIGIGTLGACVAAFGWVYYLVHSFRILMNNKSVAGIGFVARPRPWRVIRIYVFGYLIASFILGIAMSVLGSAFAAIALPNMTGELDEIFLNAPVLLSSVAAVLFYFTFFIGFSVLSQVFVTLPLARHYAETLEITGAANLPAVSQRDRDEFADAEGFAEALDLGAAI